MSHVRCLVAAPVVLNDVLRYEVKASVAMLVLILGSTELPERSIHTCRAKEDSIHGVCSGNHKSKSHVALLALLDESVGSIELRLKTRPNQ